MQKIICFLLYGCWITLVSAQSNINKAEYFFNTDPGFGNGINIPLPTPATNLADVQFNANLNLVGDGLNNLFLRTRTTDGKWSLTNRFLFVKFGAVANPNIVRVEYFFDTDPGFGNGISVPVVAGTDLANRTAVLNTASLTTGLHRLFLRSRDANGKWSLSNSFLFVKYGNISAPAINRVEYFVDLDPGFGQATALPFTASDNVVDAVGQVDLSNVSDGLHSLYLRSRDANQNWSVSNRFLFVKLAALSTTPLITAAEYFIDTDPGFGQGVPVALNAAGNLPDFIMNVNITGLSVGDHRLYLRTRNALGKWSITNVYKFPIGTTVAAPQIVVNSITKKTMCGDTKFQVAYHATGTYVGGNVFRVELSNAAGSFASPTTIGSLAGTNSGLVECTVPLNIPNGSAYRVRVVSTNPVVTGLTSDTVFTLYRQPRFSDTAVFILCQGETFNLNNVYNTTGFTVAWNTPNTSAAPAGSYQLITTNTNLCRDTAQVVVRQDVAVWTGATSKNWHVATNWSTGRVPTAVTHVIVPPNITNTCEVSTANAVVASIQIRQGALVSFINNRQLLVSATCNPLPNGP